MIIYNCINHCFISKGFNLRFDTTVQIIDIGIDIDIDKVKQRTKNRSMWNTWLSH